MSGRNTTSARNSRNCSAFSTSGEKSLDGALHSVTVAHSGLIKPAELQRRRRRVPAALIYLLYQWLNLGVDRGPSDRAICPAGRWGGGRSWQGAKTSARRSAARKPVTKSRAQACRAPRSARQRKRRRAAEAARRRFFRVSHHSEDDFDGGLRRYAKYRDLGMAKATGGMVQAHVIRFVPPCRPEEVSKLHITTSNFRWSMCSRAGSRPSSKGRARM